MFSVSLIAQDWIWRCFFNIVRMKYVILLWLFLAFKYHNLKRSNSKNSQFGLPLNLGRRPIWIKTYILMWNYRNTVVVNSSIKTWLPFLDLCKYSYVFIVCIFNKFSGKEAHMRLEFCHQYVCTYWAVHFYLHPPLKWKGS